MMSAGSTSTCTHDCDRGAQPIAPRIGAPRVGGAGWERREVCGEMRRCRPSTPAERGGESRAGVDPALPLPRPPPADHARQHSTDRRPPGPRPRQTVHAPHTPPHTATAAGAPCKKSRTYFARDGAAGPASWGRLWGVQTGSPTKSRFTWNGREVAHGSSAGVAGAVGVAGVAPPDRSRGPPVPPAKPTFHTPAAHPTLYSPHPPLP